jgi:hypothetical protein
LEDLDWLYDAIFKQNIVAPGFPANQAELSATQSMYRSWAIRVLGQFIESPGYPASDAPHPSETKEHLSANEAATKAITLVLAEAPKAFFCPPSAPCHEWIRTYLIWARNNDKWTNFTLFLVKPDGDTEVQMEEKPLELLAFQSDEKASLLLRKNELRD